MRLGDRALGVLTLLAGGALFIASLQFSPIPGQKYGAETLPRVVSFLAAGIGLSMLIKGMASEKGQRLVVVSDWARSPAAWARLIGAIALILGYIWFSDLLGFPIAGFALVFALLLLAGTRPLLALPLALATVIILQLSFGKLLLVPLPRGEFLNLPW
ncbi:tripartite tricarboxylate transporter TctB family protein [Paracoccus sp. MBLB3053]|uniref:Tripartite tricarboxylate transporter TctB family protein n=1 Tax=Paracoccus aurantius TaxID=3073814 RepID=A0ABU2HPP5_9RHOB|nr:tripartite tricarboxylate transporter TctB family protein [Paracoccus sp. MBLB3053]MDS9466727.1 tripartite tricarboxylate transporter TctB family protein [Paracoccus sp. MBLB3053]